MHGEDPETSRETEKSFQENPEHRQTEDVEIGNAIELVVAASEALVIDDLSRDGCLLVDLTAENILEAALCVKQARQELFVDMFHCQSDELHQMDSLSDLDDIIMIDAFLDVGLSSLNHENEHGCALFTFAVNDTLELENHNLQSLPRDKNPFDDISLGMNSSYVPCSFDTTGHDPSPEVPQVIAVVKQEEHVTCACARALEHEEEGILHSNAMDRFRSHQLCGWAANEAESSLKIKQSIAKIVPPPFVGQTSFLSESTDIRSVENSFLENYEGEQKVASQLSVNFKGLFNNVEEGTSVSQETRCSNQSLSDPLCSAIPCSIPSETAFSHFAHNQNGDSGDTYFRMSKPGMENITALDLNVASQAVEAKAMLLVGNDGKILEAPVHAESILMDANAWPCNDDAPEAPIKRHVSSLRMYSTGATICRSAVNDERLSPKNCAPSNLRNSSDFLPLSDLKCLVNQSSEENQKSDEIEVPTIEMNVPAKGVGMCNHASLPVANSDISSSVLASKLLLDAVVGDQNQTQDVAEGTRMVESQTNNLLNSKLRTYNPTIVENLTQTSKLLLDAVVGDQNQTQDVAEGTRMVESQTNNLLNSKLRTYNPTIVENLTRKHVRFSDFEFNLQQCKNLGDQPTSIRKGSSVTANRRSKCPIPCTLYQSHGCKHSFGSPIKDAKRLMFHGLEFLLTGFSDHKERSIIRTIQEHGGIVLSDLPAPIAPGKGRLSRSHLNQLPIVISSRKVQTTKFLYGCAVNTPILTLKWLTNSVAKGSILPPEKYLILPHQLGLKSMTIKKLVSHPNHKCIFEKVGILLYGTRRFYTKFSTIIKHGGGQVLKTLERLFDNLDTKIIVVGVIVAEDRSRALRHLKHCASERKVPMMPGSWIAKSLFLGKVLPFKENKNVLLPKKIPAITVPSDWSEEI